MALTDEVIEKLKSEHGDVWRIDDIVVDGEPITVVVKRAKKGEMSRLMKAIQDDDKRLASARALCSQIVVYPPIDEWNRLADDVELLPITVATNVMQRAAGDVKTSAKKL